MHIPENYLSPSSCAILTALMVPVWVHSIKKIKNDFPKEKITMIGVGAAFSFVGMMFNVPLPGGTTGHAVGGTLIAAMLGPEAACISISVALLLQALLFGDGGILSFGANCLNMAFAMPFMGYLIYKLLLNAFGKKSEPGISKRLISAGIASYVGINLAAFMAALELGIQPYLFHNEAGQALYCPYGLKISIPSMMIGHLTIFGLAEVVYTTAILAFISKTSPNLMAPVLQNDNSTPIHEKKSKKEQLIPVCILLGVLAILVPLGLLADGTAFAEWGSDEISEIQINGQTLGYTPEGLLNGKSLKVFMPDYSISGVHEILDYILSAVIGIAILVIIFRLIGSLGVNSKKMSKEKK